MSDRTYLGELEQMVLWAVLRLDGEGYGASLIRELTDRVDRRVSTGALFATLDRLEDKGMLVSTLADPEPGRGGRRKRLMAVTEEGRLALARTQREWRAMWEGLGVNES